MVVINLMVLGCSLFQCMAVYELCMSFAESCFPLGCPGAVGELETFPAMSCRALSGEDKWWWWRQPPVGMSQVACSSQTHACANCAASGCLSSFRIWEISCLIKGKGMAKTGDDELLWKQGIPGRGGASRPMNVVPGNSEPAKAWNYYHPGKRFACLPDHTDMLVPIKERNLP